MRQLQTQEVQSVSGAGLILGGLFNTVKTAAAVGSALGGGLAAAGEGVATAGVILVKPVATGTYNLFKFLL